MPRNFPSEWSIGDLVDLEYFLFQDAEADGSELARRDRAWYLAHLSDQERPLSRRLLLRRWLELRRAAARDQGVHSPGEVIAAVLRPARLLLFFLGALFGFGLALGVLGYAGEQPINLFAALGLLAVLPFLFMLASVVLPLVRLARRRTPAGRLGFWLTGALLARLAGRAHAFLGGRGAGRQQLALTQAWGVLRGRGGLYAGVMGWLAYGLMQLTALGFSLGVLLGVLLRGTIADLAFSWQTTARISAEQVHALVGALARPWAGFFDPPLSHPTLEQIAGSRVYLKEGLAPLVSSDLQSWWYFLLWAILVYAVLPRLLLVGVALWGGRRAERRLGFQDARCEALIRRMQHPQVRLGQEGEGPQRETGASRVLPETAQAGFARLHVLVPAELLERPAADRLSEEVRQEFNAAPQAVLGVSLDEIQDAEALRGLAELGEDCAVLMLLEGWQPCIIATLEYLKSLRRHLGPQRLLVVGLIGREAPGRWGTPTPDAEFEIWRKRLAALGDPGLLVHNWGGAAHG
ncbi:DUF2868 domain-containing protein [Geoalkalibacter halelectricus]|uniref:DUF2868 domain-containing protein n=1 Tax=Geoalkalibacter halelectricus TaxID=2847045 RepID=UPI003D1C8CF1